MMSIGLRTDGASFWRMRPRPSWKPGCDDTTESIGGLFSARLPRWITRVGSVKWFGTNTDIEDRKRTEEALRASEKSIREIVDGIPGLVCTMTAAGEVEFANRQILEYFGGTIEDLRGWTNNGALHPDDLSRVLTAWGRSVESKEPFDAEYRFRRADGVYRWFRVTSHPTLDADGRIIRWYCLKN